jgi:hypothetical protein
MGAIITADMNEKQRLEAAIRWLNSVREFKDVVKELEGMMMNAVASSSAFSHASNHGELAWLTGYAAGMSEMLDFLKGE